MTVPNVACTNCGKNFTTDDLRGTNCRYCGTLLAHHARAAQQVAVVNQMMVDRNGNGIPDAFEGIVANAQSNAMHQAFGANPYPYGQPMGPPPGMHVQMHPMHAVHMQQATQVMSKVAVIIGISVVLVVLLTIGISVAVFVLAR